MVVIEELLDRLAGDWRDPACAPQALLQSLLPIAGLATAMHDSENENEFCFDRVQQGDPDLAPPCLSHPRLRGRRGRGTTRLPARRGPRRSAPVGQSGQGVSELRSPPL